MNLRMIHEGLAAVLLSTLIPACAGDDASDDELGDTAGDSSGDSTGETTAGDTTTADTTTDETTAADTTTETTAADTTTDTTATDTTTDTTDTGTGGSFETDVYPIIAASCSCHIAGAPALLAMPDAATAYANLVSVPSSQPNGLNRVEPGDPDLSHLYKKITGTQTTGVPMPSGGPSLAPADVATIEAWITAGALP